MASDVMVRIVTLEYRLLFFWTVWNLDSSTDIDECSEDTDQCTQNCRNTIGSYTCSCNAGFTLNSDGRGCDDINECALSTDQCSQNCQNTIGSYTCSCRVGYRLNADGRVCSGKCHDNN